MFYFKITFFLYLLCSLIPVYAAKQEYSTKNFGELVVTARKQDEKLIDIPKSITVYDSQLIEDSRIDNIDDLFRYTPSLHYVNPTNAVEAPLFIRGVGNFATGEPAVGFFVDGVYLFATSYNTQELFDLERIEVLKGPQASLYGKSTTGGLINVVTKPPSKELESSITVTYGEPERYKTGFSISGPIAEKNVFGRLSVSYEDFDGYFENTFLNRNVDENEQLNLRAQIHWQPSPKLSIKPTLNIRDQDQLGFAYRRASNARDYAGISLARNELNIVKVNTFSNSIKIDYEWDDLKLTSITAVNNNDEDFQADFDYSPTPSFFARQDTNFLDVSQEFRLTGKTHQNLSWLIGIYQYYLKDDFELQILRTGPGGTPVSSLSNLSESQTYSLFGQIEFEAFPKLNTTLGLRIDHDIRQQHIVGTDKDKAFTSVSPNVNIAYQFAPKLLGYVDASIAHRPGGFNDGSVPEFNEEQTFSLEVGFKSIWGDLLSFNTAIFYSLIKEQQLFELDRTTNSLFTDNKGDGEIFGFELESILTPLPGLTLSAALTLLDAKHKDFISTNVGPNSVTGTFDLSGNKLQFVPEYEAVLSAQYSKYLGFVLDEPFTTTFRLDTRFGGPKAWDDFNSAFSKDIQLVDTSITLEGKSWQIKGFINNLLDEEYFTNFVAGFRFPFTSGDALGTRGAPRHGGVSLHYYFE